MKLDEFFDKTRSIQTEADTRAAYHDSLADWFRKLSRNVADQREAVNDEPSLAKDADEAIARYAIMAKDGPPDGSPLGGQVTPVEPKPKPTTPRRERQACLGCGLKRGHKSDCSQKPAIQERNDEGRAEGDALTKLAGRIRRDVETNGPLAFTSLCSELGVEPGELDKALALTTLARWSRNLKQVIGTWEQFLVDVARVTIKSGDRIGDTAAALSVSVDVATRAWKQILDDAALTGEKAP